MDLKSLFFFFHFLPAFRPDQGRERERERVSEMQLRQRGKGKVKKVCIFSPHSPFYLVKSLSIPIPIQTLMSYAIIMMTKKANVNQEPKLDLISLPTGNGTSGFLNETSLPRLSPNSRCILCIYAQTAALFPFPLKM
jgi:hypothetical protein